MRALIASAILFSVTLLGLAETHGMEIDRVVVYKHQRKLALVSKGKEVRSYRVALGGVPVGPKTRQGDHKTPEGVYALDSRNPNSVL